MPRSSSIRQGSFRGVNFLYQDATFDGGRRLARHEYPQRERGWPEDMGRKLRQFTLDVFVLGDDWRRQADALITALEKPGTGPLVHPLFGAMSASVDGFRHSERADELGRADFQILFLEGGDIAFTASVTQMPGSQVQSSAAAAVSQAQATTSGAFSITGGNWLQTSALGSIKSALTAVNAKIAQIQWAASAAAGTVTGVINGVSYTLNNAASLIDTPSTLMAQLTTAVQSLSGVAFAGFAWPDVFSGTAGAGAAGLGAVLAAQQDLGSYGLSGVTSVIPPAPAIAAQTPDRLQDAANTAALFSMVRIAALGEAAQAAVAQPYDNSAAAAEARDALAELIDEEMLRQSDEALIAALQDLRLALVRELNALAAQLPPLLSYTPKASMAAVVLAHRLYDDPSWAEDIVARNNIRHPLFVPGGVALEVLGNG